MLLETLDGGKKDVIIYSQNIFSAENNFRIIFKGDLKLSAKKITFSDVCMFVNDSVPKNIIIYRLLTNVPEIGIERAKFGYSMTINHTLEVIFFDPIYAIKEVESIVEKTNNFDLRFRIQQVGLSSSIFINGRPSFIEVYSMDLASREAKFQNDKVFVDALFATDKVFSSVSSQTDQRKNAKLEAQGIKIKNANGVNPAYFKNAGLELKNKTAEKRAPQEDNVKLIRHSITEDNTFDYKQVIRMTVQNESLENEKIEKPLSNKEKTKPAHSFAQFLNSKKGVNLQKDETEISMIDIFKSSSSLKEYKEGKCDKKIVLKLNL
jgi:hypothetical protein